ncbi:MAG: diguanylate cyclase [Gammaproteobacteria bacterium]|nr:diguanylate cyclase [Gammaproteobacteria bacterium]
MPIDSAQEKLQALFIAYAKNLPAKLDRIQGIWLNLLNHWDHKLFTDFHRDVHSLCGSAGTYGYTKLGKSARQLEVYLKELFDCPAISIEQKNEITDLLNKIKVTLAETGPVKFPQADLPGIVTETNHIVYIIDSDENFVLTIKNNINESGYSFAQITDISTLTAVIKLNKPAALIVNIDNIEDNGIHILQDIQQQQPTPFPLFCTSEDGGILTRLKAIRMSNNVFLQKPVDTFLLKKNLDQLCGVAIDEPYRILIIDDSLSLAEYFSIILQDVGMKTHYITNPLLLIKAIEEFQPDLLLMDIYMPECSGLELAAVIRQDTQFTRIPIIFLSTEDNRLKQLSALNLGGDDFLTKPILPQHLIEAVKSRAKRAGILSSMMMRDSLTGLLNHTTILQRLDTELSRAERQSEPLCFVMIDIDHFKEVNDQHGHPVGDRVLRSLSNLLFISLRKTDVTGRYGGEEFAIILPNTNKEQAINICNDLREKFSKIIYKLNESEFHVTFSAGISSYPEIQDQKNLIIYADKALYDAKHSGRNKVKYFIASQ